MARHGWLGVLPRHPEIVAALEVLEGAGLHSPLMSGSGSTCFAVAHSREHAERAAADLRERHPDRWIQAASWWGTS